MVLQLLQGAIRLTPVFALPFAIIVLATGIAPMGEYVPVVGEISVNLFLLAVVIIANILNGVLVLTLQGKFIGFIIINIIALLVYLAI